MATDERRCYFGTRNCAGPVRPYVMGGETVRLGCKFHCEGVYRWSEDVAASTSPSTRGRARRKSEEGEGLVIISPGDPPAPRDGTPGSD